MRTIRLSELETSFPLLHDKLMFCWQPLQVRLEYQIQEEEIMAQICNYNLTSKCERKAYQKHFSVLISITLI
jgi:hypothetical protein